MAGKYEDLLDLDKELNASLWKFKRIIAIDVLRGLIIETPRDTGRAQSNWVVGIDSPDGKIYANRSSQANSITRGVAILPKRINDSSRLVYISNNLPYIRRLNDGYSEQKPKFFVESVMRKAGLQIKDGDI